MAHHPGNPTKNHAAAMRSKIGVPRVLKMGVKSEKHLPQPTTGIVLCHPVLQVVTRRHGRKYLMADGAYPIWRIVYFQPVYDMPKSP